MIAPTIESILLAANAVERENSASSKAMTLGQLRDRVSQLLAEYHEGTPVSVLAIDDDGFQHAAWLASITIDEEDYGNSCRSCGSEIAPGRTRCGALECGLGELP